MIKELCKVCQNYAHLVAAASAAVTIEVWALPYVGNRNTISSNGEVGKLKIIEGAMTYFIFSRTSQTSNNHVGVPQYYLPG